MKKGSILLAAVASMAIAVACSAAFAGAIPPVDVPAGPIWNNADAPAKCNNVCSGLQWNKQWKTTQQGVMSVCGTTAGVDVPVGPIWSNDDAQRKCPSQLKNVTWNGNWKTTEPGLMSVCGCAVADAPQVKPISAAWMYMSDDQNYNTIPAAWNNINFKNVDVLYVGPAGVQADGTFGFYRSAKTGDLANRFNWILKTARSQNPAIKIIVSQWWGNGAGIWGGTLAVLGNPLAVGKYAASVGTFLQSYLGVNGGVDGYDVDYEGANVMPGIQPILSQIRSTIDDLGKASGNRRFYLTVSPATVDNLQPAVGALDLVNLQTYAGSYGLTPQAFTGIGLPAQKLLYGICPESNCPTRSVAEVESLYTANKLAGIHLWRLNSDNYVVEGQTQSQIYQFLHP